MGIKCLSRPSYSIEGLFKKIGDDCLIFTVDKIGARLFSVIQWLYIHADQFTATL